MASYKYLSVCLMLLGSVMPQHTSVSAARQPAEQTSAETCFGAFVEAIAHPPRDEVPESLQKARTQREAQVRAKPTAFEPLVRQALRLPNPKDLAVSGERRVRIGSESEEHRMRTARAMAAAEVLPLLGSKLCDPILTEYFAADVGLALSAERDLDARAELSGADRRIAARRAAWYASRCADLIGAANSAKSEVLLEPVFALLADGKHLARINLSAMAYLESFPNKRGEHIKRLKDVLGTDCDLGSDRRDNMQAAISRMERAETDAQPGKPDEKPDAAPPAVTQPGQPPTSERDAAALFEVMVKDALGPRPVDSRSPAREKRRADQESIVSANPEAFIPIIRTGLTLPKPATLKVPAAEDHFKAEFEPFRRSTAQAVVSAGLLKLLPATSRDALLVEFFESDVQQAQVLEQVADKELQEWVAAGRDPKSLSNTHASRRLADWYGTRCADLIKAAAITRSEVLVEPVFRVLAGEPLVSGPGVNSSAMLYLESFPARRSEFLRRMRSIIPEGRGKDFDLKYNLEKAIARMEKAEAEARPTKPDGGGDSPSPNKPPEKQPNPK